VLVVTALCDLGHSVRVPSLPAFGARVEEILEEPHETQPDLIIMGAKARKTRAGHRPLSIAYNVVSTPF
jgi:nucleotide-binding universal stress UspA family protein